MLELCRAGQPQRYEKEYIRKDGSRVPLELFVHKVSDSQGDIKYYSFYNDITERKQVEEKLRKQREHLEELVEERTYKLKAANEQLLREIADRMKAEETIRKSEERFRRITDKMLDMIRETDMEGIIQYASPSHKNILGYEPEELLGKSVFDFAHPEDKNLAMMTFQSFISDSSGKKIEYRFRHADGHYLYVSTYGNPIFDDNGHIYGAVFCSRDMTQRRQAEEELRESENRYRTIFENTGTATVIHGEDTIIYLVNTEAEKLFGYSKEEIEGNKSWTEFIAKNDLERLK
jgi:PAS domain S-box-containing protein